MKALRIAMFVFLVILGAANAWTMLPPDVFDTPLFAEDDSSEDEEYHEFA